MSDQDQALVNKLKAQEKTIRILSERLEKHITDNLSGFALFEQNITLENVVTMRTRELEAKRVELQQTLNDLKTAQAGLLQAQKLQAIGQLASGLAHEINTPTQFMSNNIGFLTDSFGDLLQAIDSCEKLTAEVSDGEAAQNLSGALADVLEEADYKFLKEEVPRALSECREGVNRITSIVGAMKEFAHPSGGTMNPVDLQRLIESTVEISRNEWNLIAKLETHFDPQLSAVEGLKDELGQVLLNMIVNAAHSIQDNNELGNVDGVIRISTRRDGDWAEITVEDNGCGIPEELCSKVFDPFFTTKDVGRGAGQGLAIAYNVVKDKHRGELDLQSEVGKGSKFTIRLPLKSQVEKVGV